MLQTKWLTLDPYMRGLDSTGPMNSVKSVGKPLVGGTVSVVVDSKAAGFSEGDCVVGCCGWQEFSIATPDDVQWGHPAYPIEKWDKSLGPPSTAV